MVLIRPAAGHGLLKDSLALAWDRAIVVMMKNQLWIVRTRGWLTALLVAIIILLAIGALASP